MQARTMKAKKGCSKNSTRNYKQKHHTKNTTETTVLQRICQTRISCVVWWQAENNAMTNPTPYQADSGFDSDVVEEDERDMLPHSDEDDDEMPTRAHAWIQFRLIILLNRYLQRDVEALPPITFQGIDRKFTPDVVVCMKENISFTEEIFPSAPPLLAVEIISLGQTMRDMVNTCQSMIASGVEECWIVEPANETVTVCTAERRFALHAGEMLTYHRLQMPLRVDDVFAVESL